VDFLHDRIPFVIIGQGSLSAEEPLSRRPSDVGDHFHLHFHILAIGNSKVFVQLDGLAVNDAVNDLAHGLSLRLFVPLLHLTRPLLTWLGLFVATTADTDTIIVLGFDRVFVATGWRFLSDGLLVNRRSRFYPYPATSRAVYFFFWTFVRRTSFVGPPGAFAAPEPWVFVVLPLRLVAVVFGPLDVGWLAEDVGLDK
jgi:hypothetical protein